MRELMKEERDRLIKEIHDLEAAKAYLRNTGKTDSEAYLEQHPELRKLLNAVPAWSDVVRKWAGEPYQKPTIEYHGTLYPTLKGDLVKSKAEKEIADALFLANIPYRYECAVSFNNGRTFYYPDFLIMNPKNGDLYIWEHFGMEDLSYYIKRNAGKIHDYFENGYRPGKNLICTYYSGEVPLTKARIRKTIDYYFK
ncbi:MAG: hypothetical protein IJ106_07225 [Parasporobacterium sp.]|nr:hypothetical protein [Parasporobacterium sp.]